MTPTAFQFSDISKATIALFSRQKISLCSKYALEVCIHKCIEAGIRMYAQLLIVKQLKE